MFPSRSIHRSLLLGLTLRLCMVFLGEALDQFSRVKYTDVDYLVFSDGAGYLVEGGSPFERATYRYSPVLALVMAPNVLLAGWIGKVLFSLADIGLGWCIYRMEVAAGKEDKAAVAAAQLWLLNPLSINISTRGSSDSLTLLMVTLVLHLTMQKRWITAAVLYGFCVHFRIYPVIYGPALWFYIATVDTPLAEKSLLKNWRAALEHLVSARTVKFLGISVFTFLLSCWGCYLVYEDDYLQEGLLYHLSRTDHRHNFSPHFYWIYLFEDNPHKRLFGLLTFLPQLALLGICALRYASMDLPFCILLQTMIFVAFNKVCTAQYFTWYVALLPIACSNVQLSYRQIIVLVLIWTAALGVWLYLAYELEFEGEDTFLPLWVASLVFLVANSVVIIQLARHHQVPKIHTA